ncbi:MAG: LysM peptidoglycan-binding domain-containing protein, partial [Firmicutes bacterium]|nr:LysM peptidoglycan-binding domain-containing protein [Bacillota bacterium]
PAAPTAPTAPNDAPNRIHTVVAGDNLSRISRQYFGNDSPATLQRIMTANNMNDPNVLTIGMQLVIPN